MSLPAIRDPHRLSGNQGVQRAARLMKALGPAASGIWAELSPEEAGQLSSAMGMPTTAGYEGGTDDRDTAAFIGAFNEQPVGEEPTSNSVWTRLSHLDPAQIAKGFEHENPQIIAVVLSRLAPDAAARTVRALPRETATAALQRLLHLGQIRKEAMQVIELAVSDLLRAGFGAAGSDGHETVARIFDQLDSRDEQGLLTALEQNEPGSGQRIRALMFTFEDLANLNPPAVQTLLASIDRAVLSVAFKGANPSVRSVFLRNMTKRAGELLLSEIEALGPVRRSEIETARQEIAKLARSLANRGDILARTDEEDELVE